MNVHVAVQKVPAARTTGYCPHCGMKYTIDQLKKQLPGGVVPKMTAPVAVRCSRCKQALSTGTSV